MQTNTKPTTSHVSIIAVFVVMVLFLSIPLVIFSTQQKQDIRQRADDLKTSDNILQPAEGSGYISGYVYFDSNLDGERSYSEKSTGGVEIKISQVNKDAYPAGSGEAKTILSTMRTNQDGFFKYEIPTYYSGSVSLRIELVLPEGYKTQDTNPVQFLGMKTTDKKMIEFGIYPIKRIY